MTNLEYMICEAERCGEINLDTRDKMLDTLYEATRFAKEIHRKKYVHKTRRR